MTTSRHQIEPADVSADVYAERLLASALGAYEVLGAYVGDRAGWWRALADGPATAAEVARRSGTDERYVREWLEMQAAYGVLSTDDLAPVDERVYMLPPGPREVLTDERSLAFLGGLPRLVAAAAKQLPALLEAYRTGTGVGWAEFGDDAYQAQAQLNRPWFEHRLADALGSLPEVDAVLARPGAVVADVGCGAGHSTAALARAYPSARVEGWDVDAATVELARRTVAEAGLEDRVEICPASAEDLGAADRLDAAFAFECVHDLPRPVEVLAAVRRAVRPDGVVVVMDEAVADRFTAPADEVDRLMYGFSLFTCLPDGRSSSPSVATGTVMRPATLAAYARDAGFDSCDVLPVADFSLFRFYRLA
ncbi:class I SAM-dependent methyltransferase [Solicola sp. PLA-1-18]|uniref:class I SAM-dependent methyltransferase n=1 Tax=Solicola sp. PLA-1-18 TaxID=3380532 RepID=UPI003B7A2B5A